nr:ribonuclease H-like domain-containing protein [Tanacetum cinerariifolium]
MHNDIMAAGSRERSPMLATRIYAQWQCIFDGPYEMTEITVPAKPTISTEEAVPEHNIVETYKNTTPEKHAYFDAETEAIHMILSGIEDDIYSTIDASKPTISTEEAVPEHNIVETYKNTTPEKHAYFDAETEAIHMILSGIEDDIYSTIDADDNYDGDHPETSNPLQPIPPPTSQLPHTVSSIKLPILKKGEYDIRAMKMEHYLCHTDYPIWQVIQNGNGPVFVTTDTNGMIKVLPPKIREEVVAGERERKARTTLQIALPEDHLAKFHKMADAKEM